MHRLQVWAAVVLVAGIGHSGDIPRIEVVRSPEKAAALVAEGRTAMARGEPERAAEIFREATRADPLSASPHANLGTLAIEDGELDAAVTAFEAAVRLDPSHQGLRQARDRYAAMQARKETLPKVDLPTLKTICEACHRFSDPKNLPRRAWPPVLREMYQRAGGFGEMDPTAVERWYLLRSPIGLPRPEGTAGRGLGRLPMQRMTVGPLPLGAARLAERCSLRPRAILTDAGNHGN